MATLPRLGSELRVERDHSTLAQDGLEEDQTDILLGRCALQRVDVVRRDEAHTGHERLECRPLARLTRGRERAERPAVEASLERDHARLPGGLPRVLERRLDRLGARVAEERLRAAEPRGEQRRELLGRLRAVEVRDVPEPLELRLRRRQRRRMTVAERDDRDPASEVEVLAAVGVPDPTALAAHDRQVRTRVRRKEPFEPL